FSSRRRHTRAKRDWSSDVCSSDLLFDRSCLGHPGKYSYCIGENEPDSPWLPLHVERGCAAGTSAVTAFACEGPRQVRNGVSQTQIGRASCRERVEIAEHSVSLR